MSVKSSVLNKQDVDLLVVEWNQVTEDIFDEFPDVFIDYSKNPRYIKLAKRFQELADSLMKTRYFNPFAEPVDEFKRRIGKCTTDWSKPPLKWVSQNGSVSDSEEVIAAKEKLKAELQPETFAAENPKSMFEKHKKQFVDFNNNNVPNIKDIAKFIQNNDYAVCEYLVGIYSLQTSTEKYSRSTSVENSVGFNSYDAKFLSSLAEQFMAKGWLSERQISSARKSIIKYQRQILNYLV